VHNAYPVMTQTFISKEMLGLQKLGLPLQIYSLFYPLACQNPMNAQKPDDVTYVLPFLNIAKLFFAHLYFIFAAPHRYWSTLFFVMRKRERTVFILKSIVGALFKHTATKEQRQDLIIHFLLAPALAKQMKNDDVTFINSHFADAAAAFSMISAKLLGLEYGVTSHAYDIFTVVPNLEEKLKYARFVLTCTEYNKTALIQKFDLNESKVHVFYHGIDTAKFERTIRPAEPAFEIFSVGRLVPKKGFDILIKACLCLSEVGIDFKCRIVGDGPLEQELTRLITTSGLQDNVELAGAVAPEKIIDYYERADIFVLPCIILENGDRDGIPNVIAEAMAMELPVVSSKVSGIPELVVDGETGYLKEQLDVRGIADAMELLARDKIQRFEMGKAGRRQAKSVFDSQKCLQNLHHFYMKEFSNNDQAS